jgi:hypothetical protein
VRFGTSLLEASPLTCSLVPASTYPRAVWCHLSTLTLIHAQFSTANCTYPRVVWYKNTCSLVLKPIYTYSKKKPITRTPKREQPSTHHHPISKIFLAVEKKKMGRSYSRRFFSVRSPSNVSTQSLAIGVAFLVVW